MMATPIRTAVELINRAERSPLKWNLDKFSVLMLPASMWALSLRPLKEEDVHGVGKGTDACARYGRRRWKRCTKTGEPVIRGTVAGTWANYNAGETLRGLSSAT